MTNYKIDQDIEQIVRGTLDCLGELVPDEGYQQREIREARLMILRAISMVAEEPGDKVGLKYFVESLYKVMEYDVRELIYEENPETKREYAFLPLSEKIVFHFARSLNRLADSEKRQ